MAEHVGLGDDRSIPKLMEFLKTAFRPSHFDDVQEILIKREEKWKVETERLKEEYDGLRLDKIAIEDDYEELKKLIFLVNNDRMATQVRERKLLEEIHNGTGLEEAEVKRVILKILELEKEKSIAEAAAALWKDKYQGLELRVLRLENDALLLGLGPTVVNNVEEGSRANDTVPQNGNCELPHVKVETDLSNCNDTLPEIGNSNFAHVKIEADESDFDEFTSPVGAQMRHSPKADFDNSQEAGGKGREDRAVIEISDSDDDCDLDIISPEKSAQTPQSKRMRKQESEAQNCCTDDNTQPSKRACLQEKMPVERTSLRNMSEFFLDNIEDSDFSDSDSDNSVDESTPVVKKYRKWNDAMEMGITFEKDAELCMDAVCALYIQEILPRGLTCSKLRGFIQSDALRGIELAKFLINGDKQGKRVKSVKELMEHDKKGVEDCKKIASRVEHCVQLFDIYKNQTDPFFPS